jgi:hypothetical protein
MGITFNADEILEIAERIERNIPSAKATKAPLPGAFSILERRR